MIGHFNVRSARYVNMARRVIVRRQKRLAVAPGAGVYHVPRCRWYRASGAKERLGPMCAAANWEECFVHNVSSLVLRYALEATRESRDRNRSVDVSIGPRPRGSCYT